MIDDGIVWLFRVLVGGTAGGRGIHRLVLLAFGQEVVDMTSRRGIVWLLVAIGLLVVFVLLGLLVVRRRGTASF